MTRRGRRVAPPTAPSVGKIDKHVLSFVQREGTNLRRVRSWISYMTLGAMLARASRLPNGPRFVVKGGVALELRLRGRARATEDLDVIAICADDDLLAAIDHALREPLGGWVLTRNPEVYPLGPHGIRTRIHLEYRDQRWATVQVDVARPDGTEEETERLPGISLAPFGLEGPREMECLSLRFQIAQKFHGLTRGVVLGEESDRFRDAVDLLLLRELVAPGDLPAIRAACELTFRLRGTHPWPPPIALPPRWRAPYAVLATDVSLAITALDAAERALQAFLAELLAA